MSAIHVDSTHITFIESLKNPQQRDWAWATFVERYTRLICFWYREWGVELDERDDLVQDTIVRVLKSIENFERVGSGSFRAWLKQLARSSWQQMNIDKSRICAMRKVDFLKTSKSRILTRESAYDHLLELFDAWATEEILNLAHAKASRQVQKETWETYKLVVLNQTDLDEVVVLHEITREMAYNRIFRVRNLVREEVDRIERQGSFPIDQPDATV